MINLLKEPEIMEGQLQTLKSDEVVLLEANNILELAPTFRVVELIEGLLNRLNPSIEEEKLFNDGLECQTLRFDAKGWRKGKIRVRFEFVLDETESPLDDIRQAIADDSQPV